MLKKLKQWQEKFTVDHAIDIAIDLLLLVVDVITSPVLIIVRLIRYIIGEWVVDKIKRYIKWIVHFYMERCNQWARIAIAVVFLIVTPFVLAIAFGLVEGLDIAFNELEHDLD